MRLAQTLAGAAICIGLVGVPPAGAQQRGQFPIAYVSMQRLLTESDDAKAIAKEIETLRDNRTRELNAKKQALEATKLEAANTGGIFTRSRHAELVEQVKREEGELQLAQQHAQAEMQALQRNAQERLRGELNTLLTKIAIERGVAYVLSQDTAIVLAPSGANLTDDVLNRMNAAYAQRQKEAAAKSEAATPKP